jgi:hypothetical protein
MDIFSHQVLRKVLFGSVIQPIGPHMGVPELTPSTLINLRTLPQAGGVQGLRSDRIDDIVGAAKRMLAVLDCP